MNKLLRSMLSAALVISTTLVISTAQASSITLNVSGTTLSSTGTFTTPFGTPPSADFPASTGGDTVTGQFTYDTNELNAVSPTGASNIPAVPTSFDSQYSFFDLPNTADVQNAGSGFLFDGSGYGIDVTVTNDATGITGVPGLSSTSVYDVLDLQGGFLGTASNMYWTLTLYASSNWFTNGQLIPNALPGGTPGVSLVQMSLYGVELQLDASGNEIATPIGEVLANVNLVAPVPVPAAFWLLGSGLLGLSAVSRRRSSPV